MSQSHIPQPNATPAAPAETYSSTDEAPHGATISRIQTPGPPPAEIPAHTTAMNGIDPMLREQFMYCDSFTWSTSDARGKMLWYKPVHPKSIHKVMERLATIYNAWGGSMEIQFKVAGTGFHAGALAFVKIPPNFNPADLQGGFDWTVFPYEVIDVKTLECDALICGDQRQVAYHYTIGEANDPKSWDHGGWVACFVYLGLNTAPSGTQQVQIMVTAKPGPDFQFSQMKMPSLKDDIIVDQIPPGIQELFEVHFASMTNITGTVNTTIEVTPAAITQSKQQSWVAIRADTGMPFDVDAWSCIYDKTINANVILNMIGSHFLTVVTNTTESLTTHMADENINYVGIPAISSLWNIVAPDNFTTWRWQKTGIQWKKSTSQVSTVQFSTSTKPPSNMPVASQNMYVDQVDINKFDGLLAFSPSLSESIVFFGNAANTNGTPQTREIATYFAIQPFMRSRCALFQLVDENEVPTMYLKLYPDGYFTTNARKDAYTLVIKDGYSLKFLQYVDKESTIPSNSPQMILSQQLNVIDAHHRSLHEL